MQVLPHQPVKYNANCRGHQQPPMLQVRSQLHRIDISLTLLHHSSFQPGQHRWIAKHNMKTLRKSDRDMCNLTPDRLAVVCGFAVVQQSSWGVTMAREISTECTSPAYCLHTLAIRSPWRQAVCLPRKVFSSMAPFFLPSRGFIASGGDKRSGWRGGDCPEDPSVRKSENGWISHESAPTCLCSDYIWE